MLQGFSKPNGSWPTSCSEVNFKGAADLLSKILFNSSFFRSSSASLRAARNASLDEKRSLGIRVWVNSRQCSHFKGG